MDTVDEVVIDQILVAPNPQRSTNNTDPAGSTVQNTATSDNHTKTTTKNISSSSARSSQSQPRASAMDYVDRFFDQNYTAKAQEEQQGGPTGGGADTSSTDGVEADLINVYFQPNSAQETSNGNKYSQSHKKGETVVPPTPPLVPNQSENGAQLPSAVATATLPPSSVGALNLPVTVTSTVPIPVAVSAASSSVDEPQGEQPVLNFVNATVSVSEEDVISIEATSSHRHPPVAETYDATVRGDGGDGEGQHYGQQGRTERDTSDREYHDNFPPAAGGDHRGHDSGVRGGNKDSGTNKYKEIAALRAEYAERIQQLEEDLRKAVEEKTKQQQQHRKKRQQQSKNDEQEQNSGNNDNEQETDDDDGDMLNDDDVDAAVARTASIRQYYHDFIASKREYDRRKQQQQQEKKEQQQQRKNGVDSKTWAGAHAAAQPLDFCDDESPESAGSQNNEGSPDGGGAASHVLSCALSPIFYLTAQQQMMRESLSSRNNKKQEEGVGGENAVGSAEVHQPPDPNSSTHHEDPAAIPIFDGHTSSSSASQQAGPQGADGGGTSPLLSTGPVVGTGGAASCLLAPFRVFGLFGKNSFNDEDEEENSKQNVSPIRRVGGSNVPSMYDIQQGVVTAEPVYGHPPSPAGLVIMEVTKCNRALAERALSRAGGDINAAVIDVLTHQVSAGAGAGGGDVPPAVEPVSALASGQRQTDSKVVRRRWRWGGKWGQF